MINPLWFHQGYDLGTFNSLEAFLKDALKYLYQRTFKSAMSPISTRLGKAGENVHPNVWRLFSGLYGA
jgi:hypothetical protein